MIVLPPTQCKGMKTSVKKQINYKNYIKKYVKLICNSCVSTVKVFRNNIFYILENQLIKSIGLNDKSSFNHCLTFQHKTVHQI